MNITLTNHPAQVQINGVPQFHEGKPIPMFPNARAIRLDGMIVGYVEIEDGKPINLNVGPTKLPAHVKNIIEKEVRKQLKTTGPIAQVIDRIETDEDE
jgi:hypothetical protein